MTKNDTPYIAVLGDAVGSRDLEPARRAALQRRLQAVLPEVNRRWRRVVAADFAIALGDQFEGLLSHDAPLWEVVHYLRAELGPVSWIIACGRGTIATALASTAPEVDGPCFHMARESLGRAKQERVVLSFAGYGEVASGFAAYYSALYWSWTERQREAAGLLRLWEPAVVAERLGVDRSAVSHLAGRIRWELVAAADAAFRRLLEGE